MERAIFLEQKLMPVKGIKIIAAIKNSIKNRAILCHTDGPAHNDHSGSDDFENFSNNG